MLRFSHELTRSVATIALLFATVAIQAQQDYLQVGSIVSMPSRTVTGFMDVPAGVDEGTRIPVAIIQGTKPGPVLALVAGSHGTEYASIIALEKLIEELDPAEVAGTVIILPLVNIASFEQRVPHVNPVDHKSMNRFYPGKPDGTQTERASWLITRDGTRYLDYSSGIGVTNTGHAHPKVAAAIAARRSTGSKATKSKSSRRKMKLSAAVNFRFA